MHGKQMIGTGCEIDKETSKVHKTDNIINVGEYRRGNEEWTIQRHRHFTQNKQTTKSHNKQQQNTKQTNNNT